MKRASPGEAETDEGPVGCSGKVRQECPGSRVLRLLHIPFLCSGGDAAGGGGEEVPDKQAQRESEAPGMIRSAVWELFLSEKGRWLSGSPRWGRLSSEGGRRQKLTS